MSLKHLSVLSKMLVFHYGGANEIWTRVSEGQGNTSTIIVYFDILLHIKQTKSIKED